MSRVTFAGVVKRYGGHTALRSFDLEVAEGEFLSLLGPSGCGKTTALRLVAGFIEPTAGRLAIDGRDMAGVPPQRRDVGMVFQDYALFPHLTIAENIGFGLVERGRRGAEVAARVEELLALVRLPGVGARHPAELSGGQQQRVALARALAYRPRVLLMDEPLGALDLKLREAMQVEIRRIQRELAVTTIYVTHDQGEAMAMSDRIAVMSEGRLEQLGPPEDIYARPHTRFVAGFVGKVNLLDGRIAGRAGRMVELDWAGTAVTAPADVDAAIGADATVALRPESIVLRPADGLSRDEATREFNAVLGVVAERVYAGNLVYAIVRTDNGGRLVVETGAGDALAREGTRVRAVWRADAAVLLGAEQGATR